MQKKVNLATLALFSCTLAMAQNEKTEQNIAQGLDENAFTFSFTFAPGNKFKRIG